MGVSFLLGLATGLRCMTPIAVVCWCAWLGYFPVEHTWAFWTGKLVSVIVFTLAAVGEWVGDTLPMTPNRTSAFPAISRVIFGGLVGAVLATAFGKSLAVGVVLSIAGAIMGTWGGFYLRRALAQRVGRDLPVALLETAATVALSCAAAAVQVGFVR